MSHLFQPWIKEIFQSKDSGGGVGDDNLFPGVQIHSVVDRSYQPRFPFGLLGDNISPTGEVFGWIMAAIYMGGRLPQIWLNVCLPACLPTHFSKQFLQVCSQLISFKLLM